MTISNLKFNDQNSNYIITPFSFLIIKLQIGKANILMKRHEIFDNQIKYHEETNIFRKPHKIFNDNQIKYHEEENILMKRRQIFK